MPDPVVSTADNELRAHVERVLSGNYELDREIGRGGMGIVYRAKDRRLKRPVAVKLLPPELAYRSEIRSRFLREAETAAQLSHPNIVPIYSVDERDGLVFFVMACIEGDNLAKRMADSGALPIGEAKRILRDVADALAYAHSRGVVHRDIKPDNILLDSNTGRPMVTDFGIARAITEGADSRLTATGMAIGTPAYMSPEQSAGDREIDGRTDLYSLGVVAYQMLAGELPFRASSTPAMLVKHISERPVPVEQRRPDVPVELSRIVMTLLEKDPANRFPSAGALVAAIDTGVMPPLPARDSRALTASSSTSVAGRTASDAYALEAGPTADDLRRWSAPVVHQFRRKLAPFIAVNAVILIMGIFTGVDLYSLTAIWSVFIAYKYAKLWAEGYDWRDVFKQPRDRMLFDVAAETIDDTRALFDRSKRDEVRARARRNRTSGFRSVFVNETATSGRTVPELGIGDVSTLAGAHAPAMQQANADRDEIIRLVESLPRGERDRIPDVVTSANALAQKVQGLALSLADLDRNAASGAAAVIDREIATLEDQANPLDHVASEERVRRLAYLKRQRRAVADVERRRTQAAAKLESCRLALQNMRFDMLRLRTGDQTHQHITLVAEQALSLAREVDSVLYVRDEMAKLTPGSRVEGRGSMG